MKQVYTAIIMYTNDYNGWYPPTTLDESNNRPGYGGGWGDPAAYNQFNGASYDTPQIYAPLLDPYLNNTETVMVCAAIQFNGNLNRSPGPTPPLDMLSQYTFYTGLNYFGGASTMGKIGSERASDLRTAASDTQSPMDYPCFCRAVASLATASPLRVRSTEMIIGDLPILGETLAKYTVARIPTVPHSFPPPTKEAPL